MANHNPKRHGIMIWPFITGLDLRFHIRMEVFDIKAC